MKNEGTSLKELKNQAHKKYKSFGLIYCKAINDHVVFNNHGWKHLAFDGKGHRRNSDNIFMRLKLVLHAPAVIEHGSIVKDEIVEVLINEKQLKVRNIELAHPIDGTNHHVTVIIRRIEESTLHYYSVRRTKNKIKRMILKQKNPQ